MWSIAEAGTLEMVLKHVCVLRESETPATMKSKRRIRDQSDHSNPPDHLWAGRLTLNQEPASVWIPNLPTSVDCIRTWTTNFGQAR